MVLPKPDVLPEAAAAESVVRPKRLPRRRTRAERQPPYAVVLHNDDINGFDYVMDVLQKVLHCNQTKAFRLALVAHEEGRSIVWSGSLEVAELKADQLRSCGPDPRMRSRGAQPLSVSIERKDGA